MTDEKKAHYSPPASQVDLERRLENGNASDKVVSTSDEYARRLAERDPDEDKGRDFRVEEQDVSGYVGVDPIYQTYANETDMPYQAEEGPEAELEEKLLGQTEESTVTPAGERAETDEKAEKARAEGEGGTAGKIEGDASEQTPARQAAAKKAAAEKQQS